MTVGRIRPLLSAAIVHSHRGETSLDVDRKEMPSIQAQKGSCLCHSSSHKMTLRLPSA